MIVNVWRNILKSSLIRFEIWDTICSDIQKAKDRGDSSTMIDGTDWDTETVRAITHKMMADGLVFKMHGTPFADEEFLITVYVPE